MSEDSPTPMKLKPKVPSELPVLLFPLPADWADWLAEHHATASGLWLRLAKKAADLFLEDAPSYAQTTAASSGYNTGEILLIAMVAIGMLYFLGNIFKSCKRAFRYA